MQSTMCSVFVCLLVCLLVIVTPTIAHKFMFGGCKKAQAVQNFDPYRFSGKWYVHTKLATTSSCLSVTFDWDESTSSFNVREERTPLTAMPLDVQVTNIGQMMLGWEEPAEMKLNWEGPLMNLLPFTSTIVDTDYETYALDVECQSLMGFAKRVSATIMTRSQEPPTKERLNKYMSLIGTHPDIELSDMKLVEQTNCVSPNDADFRFQLNNNGLSLMSLASSKKVKSLTSEDDVEKYVDEVVHDEADV